MRPTPSNSKSLTTSNTNSAGKTAMGEGLELSLLNAGHFRKSASSATTIANRVGADSALTATQNALLKKAGEMMVSSADTLNMEEGLDTLGTGLNGTTKECFQDALLLLRSPAKCGEPSPILSADQDILLSVAAFADLVNLTVLNMA